MPGYDERMTNPEFHTTDRGAYTALDEIAGCVGRATDAGGPSGEMRAWRQRGQPMWHYRITVTSDPHPIPLVLETEGDEPRPWFPLDRSSPVRLTDREILAWARQAISDIGGHWSGLMRIRWDPTKPRWSYDFNEDLDGRCSVTERVVPPDQPLASGLVYYTLERADRAEIQDWLDRRAPSIGWPWNQEDEPHPWFDPPARWDFERYEGPVDG